jgi:hypothetical protein
VKIETLTDGHLLYVAVWPLLNDILRVAAKRGVTVHQLEVSGGLAGISYSCGSAAKGGEELRRPIRDCEEDSPNSLKPAAVSRGQRTWQCGQFAPSLVSRR